MLVSWNTTKACNLKCKHCYRDAGKKERDELSLGEARLLLEEMNLAGFQIVVLSGGEPLMREDIFDIIGYGTALGMRMVLGTNGTLITKDVADKLKKSGLARVGVSLDSRNPAVHDQFRGVEGSFRRVLEAVESVKDVGLEFQVHTTVTKYNYNEIDPLIDFVADLGACAYHIFFLVPAGRGHQETESLISPKSYYRLISLILERQKGLDIELKPVCAPQFIPLAEKQGMQLRFNRGCLAGISYCCILPSGDVQPCPYLPLGLGNVRETPFSRIWKENEVFRTLRSLSYHGKCRECAYKEICGGCRARAHYHCGDYLGEDYYCAACNG